MDFLTNNFIANLYGPAFLGLYVVVIIIAFIFVNQSFYFIDKTKKNESPRIPSTPDPYCIAYIRSGPREIIKLILFNLLERGYFQLSFSKNSLKRRNNHPPLENLSEVEKEVFDWIKNPIALEDVIDSNALQAQVIAGCQKTEFWLSNQDLLTTPELQNNFNRFKKVTYTIIFALGSYKLILALYKGYNNVVFLVIFSILGVFAIESLSNLPRLSLRGKKFIEDLKMAFNPKYQQSAIKQTSYYQLLLASIFGFEYLYGKGYSFLETYKRKKQESFSSDNSSSSSSCSSSCGSSCGGGCGGCGGD